MKMMGKGVSRAVLIVALWTGVAVAADQSTAADVLARTTMQKGLDWLKGAQKANGSWSNGKYPAMTALGLWAFARSEHPEKAEICAKAAGFIEQFVQEDGGIYKPRGFFPRSGGLSTYNTAICMIALYAYDRDRYAPIILEARKFVAGSQLVGDSPGAGGFGYERPKPGSSRRGWGSRADLSNTGWAAHAMRVTEPLEDTRKGQTVDIDWKAMTAYVEGLQNQDKDDPVNYGGFGYTRGGERGGMKADKDGKVSLSGYGSMTYAGLESMIYAEVDRSDPRVQSALQWATRHWSVEENPGMGLKGLFYYYNIMSKALSLAGTDTLHDEDGGSIAWKRDLVRKLAATQGEDGSWRNSNSQFWEGDPVLVTSYVILTLEYALGM